MKKITTIILLIFSFNFCIAQNAKIRIQYHTEKSIKSETFDSLVFIVNGEKLNLINLEIKNIKLNQNGFDKLSYYYKGKENIVVTEMSCKFKPNHSYKIMPCLCCEDFMIVADSVPKRGSVRFINNTNRKLIGIRSEFNLDTINKKSKTKYLPSDISMNCGFRPFFIEITEFKYANPKFDYNEDNTEEQNQILNKEQDSLWIAKEPFLFLHGEKITAIYDDKKRKIILKFDGYLTDLEYK
ncbi:hypothetical protein [Flavobacterium aquicola]|uniref:Uncharacterized protein n=1 Tax=Flavobacterium aquicola TaxID=1682742 RepID=A0A3E0DYI9_9FLAO|nr:hypothetical protein [Flavobacterium aquicola]REG91122.1 hypothetical protein C8P67_11715 [Flavobacterium aquicola]